MEGICIKTDHVKPDKSDISTNPTGPTRSERRCHGAVFLSLSLNVFLLAGFLGLSIHYHGLAADLSSVKANLSKNLQKSLSLTEERDRLNSIFIEVAKGLDLIQSLSQCNEGLAAELSSVKASLSERLHKSLSLTKERDQLNSTLNEVTKERDRFQRLSEHKKTCPSGWTLDSGSCYLFSTESGSWNKGREDCRGRGADLVVIDSAKETSLFRFTSDQVWIGLTNKEEGGVWKWVDGTPLTLTYWDNNEPNNEGGVENCAHTRSNEKRDWNDAPCDASFKWICEKKAL